MTDEMGKQVHNLRSLHRQSASVDLDRGVDLPDEEGGSHVPQGAAHQPEYGGEERHVAEVEGGLEEAVHPEKSQGLLLLNHSCPYCISG